MVLAVAGMDEERAMAWTFVKKFCALLLLFLHYYKNCFFPSLLLLLLFCGFFRMMSCSVVIFKHVACVTCLHSQHKKLYSFEMFAFVVKEIEQKTYVISKNFFFINSASFWVLKKISQYHLNI